MVQSIYTPCKLCGKMRESPICKCELRFAKMVADMQANQRTVFQCIARGCEGCSICSTPAGAMEAGR